MKMTRISVFVLLAAAAVVFAGAESLHAADPYYLESGVGAEHYRLSLSAAMGVVALSPGDGFEPYGESLAGSFVYGVSGRYYLNSRFGLGLRIMEVYRSRDQESAARSYHRALSFALYLHSRWSFSDTLQLGAGIGYSAVFFWNYDFDDPVLQESERDAFGPALFTGLEYFFRRGMSGEFGIMAALYGGDLSFDPLAYTPGVLLYPYLAFNMYF